MPALINIEYFSIITYNISSFRFLDARNDYSFKIIFGTERNKDILIHFLNDILGFTGLAAIQDVEFLATL